MKICSSCRRCFDEAAEFCVEPDHPPLSEIIGRNCDSIGGYSLERLIGSGVKGEVYRARQIETGTPCRISIVKVDETRHDRFLGEARTAASLYHPNIADVYEAGSLESGDVFAVMEEPDGQSVRELLNNVGVPQLLTTIQVVRQAAETLHAIHQTGIIHRAVRPENIILTTDAEQRLLVRIKNLDLGGAVQHSITSNKFLIDTAIDAIRYFAPEQCVGDDATVQSDVYGLGIVFYEMLAGSPPFDAESAVGLIQQHRQQRPADVEINSFDLRMLITHSLSTALQKEPDKRQTSANAFARQLRHIEQLATHSPTPPPAVNTAAHPHVTPLSNTAVVSASASAIPSTPIIKHVAVAKAVPDGALLTIAAADADKPRMHEQSIVAASTQFPEQDPSELRIEETTAPAPETTTIEKDHRPRPERSRLLSRKKRLHSSRTTTTKESPKINTVSENNGSHVLSFQRTSAAVAAAVPVPPSATATSANINTARKIQWVQPDDDIPSEAAVVTALANAPTASSVTQSTPAPPVSISTARKIQWSQPDDDVPAGAAVIAELANVAAAPPVSLPTPATSASINTPRKIEWAQPDDDVPSDAAVLAELVNDGMPLPQFDSFDIEDEITIVERRRIQIDLEKIETPEYTFQPELPSQRPFGAREVAFFPTILGATRDARATTRARLIPGLGVVPDPTRPFAPRYYRGFMIGGGVIAAALVLLIANFVAGDQIVAGSPSTSETVRTDARKAPAPPAVKIKEETAAAVDIPSLAVRQTVDVDESTDDPKPVKAKTEASPAPEKSPSADPTPVTKIAPAIKQPQTAVDTAPLRTTLVISKKNGKLSSTIERDDEQAIQRKPARQSARPTITRPRIVATPDN
ncbi:MAG: hypothetical protein DMF62_10455 [Acidobacteria bacterium]|nr:MAG: hypothetical protein DMF62_10455 [Acidobacteriota bacterium]